MLVGLGVSDLSAPLFPMHRREALARGERSRTDTMHIVLTGVNSLLILLAIGFGYTAFGKRFRLYSVATILVLVVSGGLTATQASRLEANLPTPWAGLMERISIGGYLLWQVVLAIALTTSRRNAPSHGSGSQLAPTAASWQRPLSCNEWSRRLTRVIARRRIRQRKTRAGLC
jgi:hypothetical protein